MSQKVYVKKIGNVATVYLDEAMRPLPIASFEDVPMGFPYTSNVHAIAQKYAGSEMVWVEQSRAPQPEAEPVSDEQLRKAIGEIGVPATVQLHPSAAPQPPRTSPSAPPVLAPAIPQVNAVLDAFKDVVREAPGDVEAVGSFILRLAPELEGALRAAVEEAKAPKVAPRRFSL